MQVGQNDHEIARYQICYQIFCYQSFCEAMICLFSDQVHQVHQVPRKWIHFNDIGQGSLNCLLGGGFKYLLFSPLPGEMIQFDSYFSDGLKPPTSLGGGFKYRKPHVSLCSRVAVREMLEKLFHIFFMFIPVPT